MARRREKGSGTVYEYPKGSGIWWAKMPDDRGNAPRKWRVSSKEEGRALLRDKLRERDDGVHVAQRPVTLNQQLHYWLHEVIDVKATTREDYEQVCQARIVPYLGSTRLDALHPPIIRRWMRNLSNQYAPNTVRNAFVVLRAALQVAVNERMLKFNPTDGIKPPGGAQRESYALTAEEAQRLLTAVEGHRLYALYFVALVSGMREGELIGLRWPNVDLGQREIRIREQVQLIKNRPQHVPPKSKESVRDIPIDDDISAVLQQHWEYQQEERGRMEEEWHEQLLVFPSMVGTPLRARNLIRHFKTALRRAGLPENLRFHDLRHSAGSLMLADGVPLTDVSKILGHSSVAVTASIYAHSYTENKRKAIAGVTRRLRQAASGDH